MLHAAALRDLRTFRSELYGCFVGRADALFGLVDALLAADALPSPPHLSLVPPRRRGRGGVYAALAAGWPDPDALRVALAGRRPPAGESTRWT